jgi:hypothetical protein
MKADLHVHSSYSKDGLSTVKEITDAALQKGIGCVAITDHNCFNSYKSMAKAGEVIIVPGIEVSSAEGHILAYGVNCEIPRGKSVGETIDLIHNAGGIAVAAHPYRWWSGIGEKNVIDAFDAVETFNSRSTKGSNGKASALASKLGKPITGGSDAHHASDVGNAYSEFPCDTQDWEDVIKAILSGNVTVTGKHRTGSETVRYGFKSITEWIGRGFKKM